MKLYDHPASTTSRPVALFAAENGIALDPQVGRMKALKQWKSVTEAIDGYGASLAGPSMRAL